MFVRSVFAGMRPRLNRLLLQPGEAEEAIDCDFRSGALRGLSENLTERELEIGKNSVIPLGTDATGYPRFAQVDAQSRWVETTKRTMFIDSRGTACYIGKKDATYTPRPLSLPTLYEDWTSPGTPPSPIIPVISRTGTPVATDLVYTYAISIYNGDTGDESALSTPNAPTAISINATPAITYSSEDMNRLRALLTNYATVDLKIRLYRNSGENTFILVGTHDLPVTGQFQVTDTSLNPTEGVGGELASTIYPYPGVKVALPAGLDGLGRHPNNFLYAWKDNVIYMSDPLHYTMFPPEYALAFEHEVTAAEEHLNRLVVFFKNQRHEYVEMATPANPYKISPENAYRCVAGGSVTKTNGGIAYATNEGIAITDGPNTQLLTAQQFDETSFKGWITDDMQMAGGENDLIFFNAPSDRTGYIQDGSQLTLLSDKVTQVFFYGNSFWFIREDSHGNSILEKAFAHPVRKRKYKWKSDPKVLADEVSMKTVKVTGVYENATQDEVSGFGLNTIGEVLIGKTNSITTLVTDDRKVGITIYHDGNTYKVPADVESNYLFNVNIHQKAREWQVMLEGKADINQVAVVGDPSKTRELGIGVQQ